MGYLSNVKGGDTTMAKHRPNGAVKKHKYTTTVKLGEAQDAYHELTGNVRASGGTTQVVMSFDDVKWKRNDIILDREEWLRLRKAPKVIGEVRENDSPNRLIMSPSYAAGVLGL
jgi:hypothetical protein